MAPRELQRVLSALEEEGLLLAADARLPSVTTLVAGEPVRGSWWGHAAGERIYAVLDALSEHPAATSVKLVSRKVTFVHAELWPELLAIGSAGEPWQLSRLDVRGRDLLVAVEREGELRLDRFTAERGGPARPWLDAAKELERRLLAHAGQEHTGSGAHTRLLTSWGRWARERRLSHGRSSAADARSRFEGIVDRWRADHGGRPTLPWPTE